MCITGGDLGDVVAGHATECWVSRDYPVATYRAPWWSDDLGIQPAFGAATACPLGAP